MTKKFFGTDGIRGKTGSFPITPDFFVKIGFAAGLNYKISERLNTSLGIGVSKEEDDLGYAGNEGSDVIIGIRDVKINQAVFDMIYNIDSYKEIALEFRNYWSSVNYKRYYSLQENGIGNSIVAYPFDENPNANFNIWNLDLSYNVFNSDFKFNGDRTS